MQGLGEMETIDPPETRDQPVMVIAGPVVRQRIRRCQQYIDQNRATANELDLCKEYEAKGSL